MTFLKFTALMAALAVLASCGTIEGVGEDISSGARAVKRAL